MQTYSRLAVVAAIMATAACGGADSGTTAATTAASGSSGTGTARLFWDTPTERADGTALTPGELRGFKVYRSSDAVSYTLVATVGDPTTVSYTVEGVPAGTNYFVVSVYDVDGIESPYSNAIAMASSP